MKNFIQGFLILYFSVNVYGQKVVKMISIYSTENKDLTSLMRFQNVSMENLLFESINLKGKSYEVNLKEYKNSKLVKTTSLLDGENFVEIDSTVFSLKVLSKIENNKITLFAETERMSGEKMKFKIENEKKSHSYVLKNFQGNKKYLDVPITGEFPILAIITPVEMEKGYFSYCEIAQSEVPPEKYGEKFKLPHYFIITMKFK